MNAVPETNAIAEIALALAMAFFAIMVLAMVSMGTENIAGKVILPVGIHTPGMKLVPQTPPASIGDPKERDKGHILIFWRQKYFNIQLKKVDPVQFAIGKKEIILAVDPYINFVDAASAQQGVPASNIIVTPLDDRWSKALKEKKL